MRRISKRLIASGALEVVATAVPGMKDILVLGKVKSLDESRAADLLIVDAPAAGHAISFLLSPRGLLDAVRVGPINKQASDVVALLSDPARCQVMLVTLPEETPVSEAIETAYAIEDRAGVALGPVVVNQCFEAASRRRLGVARRGARRGRGLPAGSSRIAKRTISRARSSSARSVTTCNASRSTGCARSCRCRASSCRSCSRPTSVGRRSVCSPTRSPTGSSGCDATAPGPSGKARSRSSSPRAASSSAAAAVASARRRSRPCSRSKARAAAAIRASSRSTRPSGSPTRSASKRSPTRRARSTGSAGTTTARRRPAAASRR